MVRMLAPMNRPICPPMSPGEKEGKVVTRRFCAAHWKPGVGQQGSGQCQGCHMVGNRAVMGQGQQDGGSGDMQDRGQSAAFHPSANPWLAAVLCDPSPTRPPSSQGWDPELCALGPHRKARGVTEKPSKVIGFLLLNGFVVERLKEDVQHQEVLPVGRPLSSAKRAGWSSTLLHHFPQTSCVPQPSSFQVLPGAPVALVNYSAWCSGHMDGVCPRPGETVGWTGAGRRAGKIGQVGKKF